MEFAAAATTTTTTPLINIDENNLQFSATKLIGKNDTNYDTTWVERLILNLLSYSLILFPIAVIVFATKFNLLPGRLNNNLLIQWFVYGRGNNSSTTALLASSYSSSTRLSGRFPKQQDDTKKQTKEDISSRSTLTFLWCFLGLQLTYLIWGILQEKIMTTEYEVSSSSQTAAAPILNISSRTNNLHLNSNTTIISTNKTIRFHDSQFLVFVNRIIAFILSIIALVYNRPSKYSTPRYSLNHLQQSELTTPSTKPQAPLYEYIYCALSNILSSWCQYEALKFVNFPTQVLSKSCKIIPVMIMSKILLKKKYQSLDYICAIFLSLGMFVFLLNQAATSGSTSITTTNSTQNSLSHDKLQSLVNHQHSSLVSGLIILGLYLLFDSFTSNWQQSLFTRYSTSNWGMMAATNFYIILLTLTSLHRLGNLKPAFEMITSSKLLLFDCLMMSVMSSIGQLFIYYTIKRFGSVIFAVIMTLRQFLAILLSCAIYGHKLTLGSSAGILIVFMVIGFQMWSKSGSGKSQTGGGNKNESEKNLSDSMNEKKLSSSSNFFSKTSSTSTGQRYVPLIQSESSSSSFRLNLK